MIAGALEIQLYADLARIRKDMDDARRVVGDTMTSLSGMADMAKKALAAVGVALSVREFAGMIKGSIDAAAGLHDLSIQTGASVASLMAFRSVAATSDTTIEGIGAAMNKMAKGMAVANEESKGMGQAIQAIGLDFNKLKAMSPDEQMLSVANALDHFQDGAGKSAVAMTLFGKEGARMLPFLKDLADESDDVTAKLTEQQKRQNDAQAAMADDFGDNLVKIKKASEQWKKELAMGMLPALADASAAFLDATKKAGGLNDKIKELAEDGSIERWTRAAIEGLKDVSAAIIPAAKIWAGYYAAFVVAPAAFTAVSAAIGTLQLQIALARMEMKSGATLAALFGTSLNGVTLSAQYASGALGKLKIVTGTLFAAFAGWEIGSYLRDNFVEARVAGLSFVGAILTGWENVKYGAQMAWEGIKFAWDKTIDGLRSSFADYLSTVAKGLSFVGANDTSKQVEAYAESLRKAAASTGTFQDRTAGLTAAHKAALVAIDQNVVDLVSYELAANKAAKGADGAAKSIKKVLDFDANADTAAKKEAEAYATLIAAIKSKIDENKLELALGENVTEGQKLQIKMDQELASGKLKLTDAHKAAANAALAELGVTEDSLKLQASQRDVTKYIAESTAARDKDSASLAVQYQMYGMTADAREVAMVAMQAEAWKEAELAKLREEKKPITDQIITQLNSEAAARTLVGQATLGQGKALQYATDLAEQNKRFGLDYIMDEKARAAATLAIDDKVWQERIKNAGEGTEAQKKLQQEYATWYQNQSIKPELDAQRRMWESVEQTAHDTFISIFDSGKSAFDRLRDALKNGLLDLLYQMTIRKWIFNIGAAVSISGAGGVAQAAGTGAAGAAGGTIAGGAIGGIFGAGGLGGSLLAGAGWLTGSSTLGGSLSAAGSLIGTGSTAGIASGIGMGVGALAPIAIGIAAGASLLKAAFGMSDKEVTSAGMRGTLSANGLTGENYSTWHQDGGWFRSDKSGTDITGFTGDVVKQFTQGFDAIKAASSNLAQAIGADASSLADYSKTFDIALGKDQAANEKAVTDFFNGLSDEIAKRLVPNLDDFTKSGETASAALQRLAGDFDATNTMAQMLGKSAKTVFGSLGMDSASARERLVSLFGDTQTLGQLTGSYAQNFLTEAERIKPVREALDAAMASLGLTCVQTREQFKAVVDSLDLTTDAGAKEFVSLMKLADAFAQVHPAIESTTDALQSMKDAAGGLLGDVDSAYSVLQKVVEREKSTLQVRIDAETAAVTKLKSLSDALHSSLDSFTVPNQQALDRAAAQAQIKTALAIAKAGGPLPDADSLKNSLSVLSQDASSQFATYTDYLRDFYNTKNDIAALAGTTDDSLSVEQRSLDALNKQVKALDDMLAQEQQAVDALKGIDNSMLSLSQAIQALSTAILSAQSNPLVSAGSAISSAYQKSLGRTPDAAGLAYWQQQIASGASVSDVVGAIGNSREAQIQQLYHSLLGNRGADAAGLQFWLKSGASMSEIEARIKGSDEYKNLHPFAVGINRVPSDMPAYLHEDEAVVPAALNPFNPNARMNGLGSNTERLERLIEGLTATVQSQQAALNKIANSSKRSSDILETVTEGGNAMRTA
jgi:hypothetical protein